MVTIAFSDGVGALWSEFEDEVWIIPADRAKEQYKVPLLSLALAIFAAVKPLRREDGFVSFPATSRAGRSATWPALVDQGAKVTVVAREKAALAAVEQRLGVAVIAADVTDQEAARRILADVRPEVLVLNAGAPPHMGRLDQLSWADFTAPWETDVKGGLYWMQAALNLPLAPGARVLVGSSGAALQGSPLAGGYAGARRMLWLMARDANGVAEQKRLGIRFQAIVPQQMIGGPGSATRGPAPTFGRWASSPRRSWPGSARRFAAWLGRSRAPCHVPRIRSKAAWQASGRAGAPSR